MTSLDDRSFFYIRDGEGVGKATKQKRPLILQISPRMASLRHGMC